MSKFNDMQPLKWPVDWENLTPCQKLLMDAPFVGILDRAFKDIAIQIRQRTQNCSEHWSEFSPMEVSVEQKISKIVIEEIGWPNNHFIPIDPFEIITWGGGDCLATAAVLTRIENEFGLGGKTDGEWKDLACHNFGYVVQKIALEIAQKKLKSVCQSTMEHGSDKLGL